MGVVRRGARWLPLPVVVALTLGVWSVFGVAMRSSTEQHDWTLSVDSAAWMPHAHAGVAGNAASGAVANLPMPQGTPADKAAPDHPRMADERSSRFAPPPASAAITVDVYVDVPDDEDELFPGRAPDGGTRVDVPVDLTGPRPDVSTHGHDCGTAPVHEVDHEP